MVPYWVVHEEVCLILPARPLFYSASNSQRLPSLSAQQVELHLARLVHDEACYAVQDLVINGDPGKMQAYLTTSRATTYDG